jgi:hypothetical protein
MTKEDIIGTKWMVAQPGSSLQDKIFEFCANGLLKYGDIISKWELKDGIIIISQNNGYAILKGQIVDNVLTGTASNKVGKNWTFKGELISNTQHLEPTNDMIVSEGLGQSVNSIIETIYLSIKDFRADENNSAVLMTKNRITRWVNQFDEGDRIFILTELKNIIDKRYCTKQNSYDFLKVSLESLKQHYNYASVQDFLSDSVFLDLQRPNKSQPTLLKLLKVVLNEQFNFYISNCGSNQKKNYIYLDDVLCTGNTLFQDIKAWVNLNDNDGQTYLSKLQSGNIKLVFLYLFIHETNYHKKRAQFRHQISQSFDNYFTMFRAIEIQNGIGTKLEVITPTEENQPEMVEQYKNQVIEKVDAYCEKKNISKPNPEFFRPTNNLVTEEFFTSAQNRKRFEDIMLHRGIRILNSANTNIPNLRALGYSLPSLKNFGFGTLAMTWRNIPNNCPIVFWYSGGGFYPLFVKNQT